MVMERKKACLYDKLVWGLLVWCVFQDLFLAAMLSLTGAVGVVKLLFHMKDVLLLCLFFAALARIRISHGIAACYFLYFGLIMVQMGRTLITAGKAYSYVSILSSVRGLILLPTLTIIGYSVHNKGLFLEKTERYYWFLLVIALIGLIEFEADRLFGTKSFWMDKLKLNEYYTIIKGQPALIENGTPGNWYTDIGRGYRTQKRLISIWAAPLTAGFVLLPPALYSVLHLFKQKKILSGVITTSHIYFLVGSIVFVIALLLTFTRQTILPFLMICVASCLFYNKKNREIMIVCIIVMVMIVGVSISNRIIDYLNNGSTKVHLILLKEGLSNLSFFGRGVGTFGTRFAETIATESQYITLIGQLGLLSLPLYLVILIYPILYCRKRIKGADQYSRIMIVSICFAGLSYLLAGIISETVAAFTSIAQYYVLIGVSWGFCREMNKESIRYGT